MTRPLSDAERQFLSTAVLDTQQRLAGVAALEGIRVDDADDGSIIVVSDVLAGSRRREFRGHGDRGVLGPVRPLPAVNRRT